MSLAHAFIGLWQLKSWYLKDKLGNIIYPYGPDPKGYLLYTNAGSMSVHLMSAERPPFKSDSVFEASPNEALSLLTSYSSYCGRYEIVGNKVRHHIELISIPNWIGTTQEREFVINDKLLTLTHTLFHAGEEKYSELVWQK